MRTRTLLLASVAVLSATSCAHLEGWTVTGSIPIPNPNGGKEPVGHINISRTWYGKEKAEVSPPLPTLNQK